MKIALLVIDMQRIYAAGGAWETEGLETVAENIVNLCGKYKNRLFTRHLPFDNPPGRWKSYNEVNADVNSDPEGILLLPELASIPHQLFDKYTYSALESGRLREYLLTEQYDEILITGVQTEFCVLSTMMTAVDLGLPVTIVPDACAASLPIFNEAIVLLAELIPAQIEIKYSKELLNG